MQSAANQGFAYVLSRMTDYPRRVDPVLAGHPVCRDLRQTACLSEIIRTDFETGPRVDPPGLVFRVEPPFEHGTSRLQSAGHGLKKNVTGAMK
jgi:hypothetical protein